MGVQIARQWVHTLIQHTGWQLIGTSDRQNSSGCRHFISHQFLSPVHKITPNVFKRCSWASPSFLLFHMGLALHCSIQVENVHNREYVKVYVSLVLEVCLQGTNLEQKHTNTSSANTNNDKSLLFVLPLANQTQRFQTTRLLATDPLSKPGSQF